MSISCRIISTWTSYFDSTTMSFESMLMSLCCRVYLYSLIVFDMLLLIQSHSSLNESKLLSRIEFDSWQMTTTWRTTSKAFSILVLIFSFAFLNALTLTVTLYCLMNLNVMKLMTSCSRSAFLIFLIFAMTFWFKISLMFDKQMRHRQIWSFFETKIIYSQQLIVGFFLSFLDFEQIIFILDNLRFLSFKYL